MNRSAMPGPGDWSTNPEMVREISQNPAFQAIVQQLENEREMQAQRWNYTYTLSDSIVGQQTQPFNITIEQGTDFKALWLTASAFSYDSENDTDFPVPNALGATAWAGRGLSVQITDTTSGRELTSGFVAFELLASPGYGLNFQNPFPFKYFFYRNTKIRFDVRNRDNSDRTHYFEVALNGFKCLSPNG